MIKDRFDKQVVLPDNHNDFSYAFNGKYAWTKKVIELSNINENNTYRVFDIRTKQ